MMESKMSGMLSAGLFALSLAGCAGESDSAAGADQPEDVATEADSKVAIAEQALGGPAGVLPLRGTTPGIVESKFFGSGMVYAMNLRTGALVDQLTVHFYTPTRADNRFSPGDKTFSGGPFGGTAGSAQPTTTCPGGYAAHGLFGGAGKHVDRLGLVCARIGSDGLPITSDVKVLDAWGGSGGTFFFDVCGAGKWLRGIAAGAALKSSGSNKIIGFVQGYCANAR